MYINNKILIGKNDKKEANLVLNMANRHGVITGASGSGKTITLKVLAESFSQAGVPVFMVDVKGDLAATCKMGVSNENVDKRVEKLKLKEFEYKEFPVRFYDVYGILGHPIRTTVSNIGPRLLSRMLNLTEAQEGVLNIIFKIAEDENLEMIDLKDFKSMITYVGDKRAEYTTKYGNVNVQSIGGIQRNLLVLEQEGGDNFFGKPAFDINDFIAYDNENGVINILDAVTLFKKPTLYATYLLWLLNELYDKMPEVGDLEKPKLVFFIDEAHLLFSEMPDYMVKQIIQIVKLIRSKGIGLYFISQSPSDIPDEILNQLGNRIQHVLRCYTKIEEKSLKAAADSFRANPDFDTMEEIKSLGTGEALISLQTEEGEPDIVDKYTILPPQSMMGTLDDTERIMKIRTSPLYMKYENKIDDISAFEKIDEYNKNAQKREEIEQKNKEMQKLEKKLTNQAVNTIGRGLGRKILKSFFK